MKYTTVQNIFVSETWREIARHFTLFLLSAFAVRYLDQLCEGRHPGPPPATLRFVFTPSAGPVKCSLYHPAGFDTFPDCPPTRDEKKSQRVSHQEKLHFTFLIHPTWRPWPCCSRRVRCHLGDISLRMYPWYCLPSQKIKHRHWVIAIFFVNCIIPRCFCLVWIFNNF